MNDPRRIARLTGALWLVVIAVSVVAVLTQKGQPRLAFAATQLGGLFYLGVTVLLYALFKPVDTSVALFAAVCGVAGVASGAASDASGPAATQGFLISMVFFGSQIVAVGYLITRSNLIPRALGVLLILGGSSYLLNSFTNFLSPSVGAHLAPFVIPIAIVGEGAFTLWLLIKGVKVSLQ